MAYQAIEPIQLPPTSAVAATYVITIADYGLSLVNDDYILVSIVCGATSGTLSASAGWSELSEISVTNGPRMAQYLAKVAAGTVADLTVTLSTGTGVWLGCLEQWRDVDTTTGTITTDFCETPVTSQTTTVNVTTLASGSSTPSVNDCTIHYFGATRNGSAITPCRFLSDEVVGQAMQNTDDNNTFISYGIGTVQQQTAADTNKTMYNAVGCRCGIIVLNIKNKSGGKVELDCRAAITKVGWFGDFGITHESGAALAASLAAPSTFCVWNAGTEQINGIDVHTTAGTMTNDTAGLAPVSGRYSQIASTLNTANMWVGGWWATPAPIDMTGKIFSIEWHLTLAGFQIGPEGVLIVFGDNATADTGNAAVFQLAPKGKINAPEAYTSHIAVETADQYATIGSINSFDWATVNKIGIFYHRAGSSATSRQVVFRNMLLHGTSEMVGGSAAKPLDIRFLDKALNGWGYAGLCTKTGDAVLVKSSVQFGDGTIPTYVDTTATLLNTPSAYSSSTQHLWNAPANTVTIGVKAASGDTMSFVASAMAAGAGSEQNFTIDAATSATATYSFAGEVISNFLFAGDTDVPISGATYSGCDEVGFAGATVTNTTVTNTTSTDAAASVDANTTITSTTIDGTGALYAIELGATVTAITLADCAITAGSTDKIHVKATTGIVTITISGTTNINSDPSVDVTTDGATVVIAAPELYQSVAITGLAATYRLHIFDIEYDLTVSGITVTPTAGATYTHNGITWTVRSASITLGSGTITVYGTGAPATSGTLTKTGGTGDASVTFSAYAVGGTELYQGVPGATFYTWTDSVAATAPRVIRIRVMEDGPGTSDAIIMIDAIVGMCGITDGTETVGYLVAAVTDSVYNDRGVDGSTITGITIDDSTLRFEISSGTVVDYDGVDVLVIDGRDIYAYETYWLGTAAGIVDEARIITATDAANFRCSRFKFRNDTIYPVLIVNAYMIDAATGIFATLVDYSGGQISNGPDHVAVQTITTSDAVVSGTLLDFIAAVPTANDTAAAVGARTVEGAYSEDEILKLLAAALAGQRQGIGTAAETYTGLDGATVRISLTPDANGNGTPVLDVT